MCSSNYIFALITAFKFTGKDKIVQYINDDCKKEFKMEYRVFGPKEGAKMKEFHQFTINHSLRVALADPLKNETHHYLKLQNCKSNSFEHVKDNALFQDPYNPSIYKTIRQWYIEFGAQKKKEFGDYYWIDRAHHVVETNLNNQNVSVTDWRFKCENKPLKDGTKPLTLRLYRKEVKEAPMNVDSEHNLDDELTDFLLVSPDSEQQVFERFPQYNDSYEIKYTISL